jgi:AcrR family transcriptional regulator
MVTATTKARILAVALDLFNQSGTAEVTTNHIAAVAGISPGNLYYHYRNKEEIIRAVVARLFDEFDNLWESSPMLTLAGIQGVLSDTFALQWRFRFFLRERTAVLRNDPRLSRRYQETYQQRMAQQMAFFRQFVAAGVVREPADPDGLRHLLTALWIISENWLTFLESIGQPVDVAQFQAGSETMLALITPYLAS